MVQSRVAHTLKNPLKILSIVLNQILQKNNISFLESLFEMKQHYMLVMNVEALSTDKGVKFVRKFINSHKTLMAIDESTTIKTPTAKRTKNIIR